MTPRSWLLFAAISLIWGLPYLFVKVAVDAGLSPGFLACARAVIGLAVLTPFAWRSGALRGLGPRWRGLLAYSVAEVCLPMLLLGWGEQRISSSLAAILIATAPLCVAVLALRFDASERVTGTRLTGLLVGLAGVAALVGIDVAGSGRALLGTAALLLCALCYAVGPLIVRRSLRGVPSLGVVTVSMYVAAVTLAPLAIAAPPSSTPPGKAIAAVVVLGVVCSALAYSIYVALIGLIGAGRALIVTYINPVVALAAGIVFLDEALTTGAVIGLLLVLAGSWLATAGRLPARALSLGPSRRG
jgi:drug/metabolite transporter (DMT)-like permease